MGRRRDVAAGKAPLLRAAAPMILALLADPPARAAFEPVPQSPWLAAGPASALFARTPFISIENPALAGLLDGFFVSAQAARPFGLDELDRGGIICGLPFESFRLCGAVLASGGSGYGEFTATLPAAARITPDILAGIAPSFHHLSIDGYGSGSGFSIDCGFLARPVRGAFLQAGVHGLARTDIGSTRDPATPRRLSVSAGVWPVERAGLAVGASRQEGLGTELSAAAFYFPAGGLGLQLSFLTDPARFGAAITMGIPGVDLLYGYTEHPDLRGTHSFELCTGNPVSPPEPVTREAPPAASAPAVNGPVDINTAGIDELCTLPGIGPAKAEAIIRWREAHGPFSTPADLSAVPGIGEAMVESLGESITTR